MARNVVEGVWQQLVKADAAVAFHRNATVSKWNVIYCL
ncbi:hypothetical protein CCACVL1_21131 [Corchorus capsularis]|uniref:Uncharacterized protein n=1 Tax=Corchorus capsularis TaxID=210143 RepID=A0A1R3H872_COCAP|nr:hypothetical protein CCACVL1_21131 [Corchorus capsularis]